MVSAPRLRPAAAPALNDRQRAYLLAIFETDLAVEADMRSIPFSPFHERPKASEWRWLEYSEPIPIIGKDASRLHAAIKKAPKIVQGTRSTFDALAARRLVCTRCRSTCPSTSGDAVTRPARAGTGRTSLALARQLGLGA